MRFCGDMAGGRIKTLVIPEGVTEIGAEAFYWHTGVEEIYLPSTLERISGTILRGSTSEKLTVYYSGDNKAAIEKKIVILDGELGWLDEFIAVFTNNCSEVEWITGDEADRFYDRMLAEN